MGQALEDVKLTTRTRRAAQLYVSGACPTKRAASEAAGLHPNYLTMLSNKNTAMIEYLASLEGAIQDETIDMSTVATRLGREAILKMARLMHAGDKDEVQLRAAVELADRSPETQKVQKVDTTVLHVGTEDVRVLAAAMIESAKIKELYASAKDGLVEVSWDDREISSTPAPRALSPTSDETPDNKNQTPIEP